MSITFKDNTGNVCFALTDLVRKGLSHAFIEYNFHFRNDEFEAKIALEAEPFDLDDLLNGLIYLSNNLKGGFCFEPMVSGRIKIEFEINDQGHIAINGVVYDQFYSISLSFKFSSDQTFLSELISQCSEVINSLAEY